MSGWPRGLPQGSISVWPSAMVYSLASMFLKNTVSLQPLGSAALGIDKTQITPEKRSVIKKSKKQKDSAQRKNKRTKPKKTDKISGNLDFHARVSYFASILAGSYSDSSAILMTEDESEDEWEKPLRPVNPGVPTDSSLLKREGADAGTVEKATATSSGSEFVPPERSE